MNLKVNEIFNSISGEYSFFGQGVTCTFLRLAGCNINCSYCDTSFEENYEIPVELLVPSLLEECQKTGHLCITGGEPLLQIEAIKELLPFLTKVWIETNGTIDFTSLINKVPLVVDYKLWYCRGHAPEYGPFIPKYYYDLGENDCIKFVIKTYDEFLECLKIHKKIHSISDVKFAYSPIIEEGEVKNIDTSIVSKVIKTLEKEGLSGYFNLQIHKYLGLK